MTDEIIEELWSIKDQIAKEHGYDLNSLAAYLKSKEPEESKQAEPSAYLLRTSDCEV